MNWLIAGLLVVLVCGVVVYAVDRYFYPPDRGDER